MVTEMLPLIEKCVPLHHIKCLNLNECSTPYLLRCRLCADSQAVHAKRGGAQGEGIAGTLKVMDAAGICILLAGTIAYRLPGFAQWTADTSTTPYYLVAGLTLLAAGCLLKLSRPVTGGLQFALVATLAALSTE